ncbi:MAG: hypothetical protein LZF61_04800 [Nitrosomonas sp.]|nr:MAG: hypothetical protein LZF61_04800 [Nitrosomonas sp.]
MKPWLTYPLLLLTMLIASLPASAQAITPINEIIANPVNFDGQEVTLKGLPKNPTRLPLIDLKSYILEDSSGEITVLTESELPKMSETVTIRALVKSVAIVKGEALGLTVTELERYEQRQKI